jgi:Ca2+-binding EF-hand superfamily protein
MILNELVDEFNRLDSRDMWHPHPAFGSFTKEQWGQLQYKHLDHHLKQFGV